MAKKEETPTVQFRCPSELVDRLRDDAAREMRTLSQQVAWLVKRHYDARPRPMEGATHER